MRRPPIISWEGVRTLEKKKKNKTIKNNNNKNTQKNKKKKKKKEKLGGWEWELRTPEWRVMWRGGPPSPLFCMRGTLDVWCSY